MLTYLMKTHSMLIGYSHAIKPYMRMIIIDTPLRPVYMLRLIRNDYHRDRKNELLP
jgi:hypothetical protein